MKTGRGKLWRRRPSFTVRPVPLYSPLSALQISVTPPSDLCQSPFFLKYGFIVGIGDVEGGRVRNRAFGPVSRLDEHLSVVGKNEEDDAVVCCLLPDSPRLGDPLGVSAISESLCFFG